MFLKLVEPNYALRYNHLDQWPYTTLLGDLKNSKKSTKKPFVHLNTIF